MNKKYKIIVSILFIIFISYVTFVHLGSYYMAQIILNRVDFNQITATSQEWKLNTRYIPDHATTYSFGSINLYLPLSTKEINNLSKSWAGGVRLYDENVSITLAEKPKNMTAAEYYLADSEYKTLCEKYFKENKAWCQDDYIFYRDVYEPDLQSISLLQSSSENLTKAKKIALAYDETKNAEFVYHFRTGEIDGYRIISSKERGQKTYRHEVLHNQGSFTLLLQGFSEDEADYIINSVVIEN